MKIARLAGILVLVGAWTTAPFGEDDGSMLAAPILLGCSSAPSKTARDAVEGGLTAFQLACIFNSTITNDEELASLCDVAKPLLPIVRNLISQREGAKRSGVRWENGSPKDGGVDAP